MCIRDRPKTVKITAAGIEDSIEIAYGDVSKHATLVQNLGDMSADDDVVTVNIEVDTCKPTKETLESIKEFVAMINADEPSKVVVASADISKHLSQKEIAFLNKHVKGENCDDIKRLLQAGCYLQMESLRNLAATWMACEFIRKTDELKDDDKCIEFTRSFFGIEDDWNVEQKKVLAEQLKWAK
eukprot:TRINITY_DN18885_c0_g1_i1.p2 TRINITY_DN18885_c0_g1~~TRINITY_DN18885_c0_g1_i1.p2  ORF type:complete len:184 (+),score=119.77 TRINITY_DN18885_c0_g1_i1:64-615(+)